MTTAKGIQKICVAHGDGIGPEIMDATLHILKAAGVPLEFVPIEMGEKVYLSGNPAGVSKDAWAEITKNKIVLKAPMTTPQGGGYKSINVTLRKTLGLYCNLRPCRTFAPYVSGKASKMDMVIVRENEEDLYAGIEHRQTWDSFQCLKLVSRSGAERIIRYAFEYAKANGRKKVTCMSKDNIMKLTDGLFHKMFEEMGAEYPDIAQDHMIIDIGSAKIAASPERFDVIVTGNLYGDIISDIAAEVSGSVGLAGSANLGHEYAVFEAIHGSAPDISGQGIANPSGLLNSALMMLQHMGLGTYADSIERAWAATIEAGIHTADIYRDGASVQKVSTLDFAKAVVAHFGKSPQGLKLMFAGCTTALPMDLKKKVASSATFGSGKRDLVGTDVFLYEPKLTANELGAKLKASTESVGVGYKLQFLSNRGMVVWPDGFEGTRCIDNWRCRFLNNDTAKVLSGADTVRLLGVVQSAGFDIIKTENLYNFDGVAGYSKGQGEG